MPRVKTIGLALAGFVAATACFGSEAFAQEPPAPVAPAPTPGPTVVVVQQGSQMRSPGLVAGGGTLIGLGGLAVLIGIPVTIVGAAVNNACDSLDINGACQASGVSTTLAVGIVMDILGAGMVAGGIAMVVIGSEDVQPSVSEGEAPKPSPIPEVRIGAGNAQLSWAF